MYLECLLQLWQYKHKPSPCHFLLLHSSGPSVTHIVSPYQGLVTSVNITSVWAALTVTRSQDLVIWFLSSMRWVEQRPGARMSSYGTSWYRDFSSFILQDFSRSSLSTPSSSSPAITSIIPTALLPMPFFYWVSFWRPQLLKDLCWDYPRYWRLVTCAWSLSALETTGAITCITWSVQCSTTWHRLYCAVHCTVLSTPHQTIIGTSSPHGLDDK